MQAGKPYVDLISEWLLISSNDHNQAIVPQKTLFVASFQNSLNIYTSSIF